ncbi:Ubiquinone/menaquinone biosynthesis C-methylase UbiE [Lentzea albidocapillata subsp. violacea]|uniref:Ubiquinone/menaquinone biosynthesis C-methylase UbiE n=1 Tax=Lentzea albidocapillata subsp. violacea TaxID=128104 RepID=A0A1G8TZ21_9PSEU|nr:methyltransferase domain-containing protein [Lentzea albidocapillata]SDJ46826.1 Ubiquinone/menaquinone biosynthesis C-methylase UbiE [Lentzea albidocapillata subsp. violacea]
MSTTDDQAAEAKYDYKADEDMRTDVWDENLHVGYWSGPEDTSAVEVATDQLTDFVIERTRIAAGQRLLDVGCGLGKPARRAAERTGCGVAGISDDPAQVKRANEAAEAAGAAEQVKFLHADAMEPLPFGAAEFDAAWAIESLVHMPDREKAFRNIAAVLKPGATLVATDFFENVPLDGARKEAVDAFLGVASLGPIPRLDDYPALLRSTGFELVEFLDITENTHRTYALLLQSLYDTEKELRADHGDAVFDGFVKAFKGCAESLVPRYMLFVARRSADS